MQINPPFGYREIVPFYRASRVRLPAPGALPEFARSSNAIPISYSEFSAACRDYPLAFSTSDGGATFAAIAIVGLADRENLYVGDAGWDPAVYLPAYIRRYPFCMARVTIDAVEQADRLVCVERDFLAEDGEPMFDDAGGPLERWRPIEKLVNEYEADLERSREMCATLAEYALLEPFSMQAQLRDGGAMNLGGMHRVEEKKLESLNAAQHRNLLRKGILGRIYAHLLSLDNFGRLLARRHRAAQAS